VSVRESDGAQGLEPASIVELFGRPVDQVSSISRQEPPVARLELACKTRRAVFGIMLSTGAAMLALATLLCEAGVAVAGLTGIVPVRVAALIMAAALACAAGLAGLSAVRGR